MNNDLISVIVPVYNVEKYLKKCVDSVINQTYQNIEIILVDDESPDNCPKICDEYEKKDSRIKVIHKKNGGLSEARNFGIDISKGKFLMFVDSDDYLDTTIVFKLYESLAKYNSDLSICGYKKIDDKGNILEKIDEIWDKQILSKREVFCNFENKSGVFVIACAKLYKRDLFDNLEYKVGKLHEDEFMIHHIIGKCNIISVVNESLYYYLVRANSITNKAFDIKRLDSVEAFIDRYVFFKNQKESNLSQNAIVRAYGVLYSNMNKIDFSDQKNKKRVRELITGFLKVHWYNIRILKLWILYLKN